LSNKPSTKPVLTGRAWWADRIALLASVPAILAIVGLAGSWHWVIDLLAGFRWQYALVLLPAVIALAGLRSWRSATLLGAVMLLNAWPLAPVLWPAGDPSPADAPRLRLAHFNLHTSNENQAGVIAALRDLDVDLIGVQEINFPWLDSLRAEPGWQVVSAKPRDDNYGIALLAPVGSQITVESPRVFDVTQGQAMVPAIEATLRMGNRSVALLYVHTLPPVNGEYARDRDVQLQAIARWVRQQQGPVVVMGDLNAGPTSASFRRLLRESGLRDSMRGRGYQGSWPEFLPSGLSLPIDHVLHNDQMQTARRHVGGSHGSDHRVVTAELILP
jgi:endonuclease/exonuclease/phosphatase (EEP) superfamily protein YafD